MHVSDDDEVAICHGQACVNPKWRWVAGFKQQQPVTCKWTRRISASRQPNLYLPTQHQRLTLPQIKKKTLVNYSLFFNLNPSRPFSPYFLFDIFSLLSLKMIQSEVGQQRAMSAVCCRMRVWCALCVFCVCECWRMREVQSVRERFTLCLMWVSLALCSLRCSQGLAYS